MKNFPLLVCMEESSCQRPHAVTWRQGIVAFWEVADFSQAWRDGQPETGQYLHVPVLPGTQEMDGIVDRLWPRIEPEMVLWVKDSHRMPRRAATLLLTVTAVRVERVQEISDADAKAEGIVPILVPPDGGSAPYVVTFRYLWDSLNASRGYSWEANPWVWVIAFRRVETPERADG